MRYSSYFNLIKVNRLCKTQNRAKMAILGHFEPIFEVQNDAGEA